MIHIGLPQNFEMKNFLSIFLCSPTLWPLEFSYHARLRTLATTELSLTRSRDVWSCLLFTLQ